MAGAAAASRGVLCGTPTKVGLTAGAGALVLFGMTAAPGVCWGDSGVHQYRILTGMLENPFGLALSHPLHYWLGRLAIRLPLGEPAYTLNLMSAFFGATGVALVAALVMAITGRRFAAAVAAAAVALSHSFWQMSAVTETYTLAAALMTVEWCLLLAYARRGNPWLLCGVFAVNGLHVANDLLGTLTLVTYIGLLMERALRRRVAPRWLAACALAWIVTASPYWTLAVAHWRAHGDAAATVHSAFFGGGPAGVGYARDVLNLDLAAWMIRKSVPTLGYNAPNLTLAVALLGMLRLMVGTARLFKIVLIAQTLVIVGFVGRYSIPDQYTFFVPVCALMGLWCGLGADQWLSLASTAGRRAAIGAILTINALLPPAVYVVFPIIAQQRAWLRTDMRDILHREEYRHFLRPWKFDDDSAETFARDALARAGRGGWLLADVMTAYATGYVSLVHGGPPGARVYRERTCLTHSQPDLTADELHRHLRSGGRVISVPYLGVEALWGDQFEIDKGGYFWHLRLREREESG